MFSLGMGSMHYFIYEMGAWLLCQFSISGLRQTLQTYTRPVQTTKWNIEKKKREKEMGQQDPENMLGMTNSFCFWFRIKQLLKLD